MSSEVNANSKLVKVLYKNIDKCIDEVFADIDSIRSYLAVVGRFPIFNYRNHLLIWRQKKDAECLASKKSCEKQGIKLKEDAQPIALLYPNIKLVKEGRPKMNDGKAQEGKLTMDMIYEVLPEYECESLAVCLYDIGDAGKYSKEKMQVCDIFQGIKRNSNIKISFTDNLDVLGKNLGRFDSDNNTFLIRSELNPVSLKRTIINLYTEEELFNEEEDSSDFTEALMTTVTKALELLFGVLKDTETFIELRTFITDASFEEKNELLAKLSKYVSTITMDFTEYSLSFNEIAYANSLVRGNDASKVAVTLYTVKQAVTDDTIRDEMDDFLTKIQFADDEYLTKLNAAVRNEELYVFPEYEYHVDPALLGAGERKD